LTTTSIEALRRLAGFTADALIQEVGPFALVQRAPPSLSPASLHRQLSRTVELEGRPQVARQALSLMLGLDEGLVVPLGRDAPEGSVVLGRGDDVDVRLEDSSVSSRHARVGWDGWQRAAWVEDLGSTNGTLVNGREILGVQPLAEGNVLTLGDETAFLFLTSQTLFAMLRPR
jgi:hypothetical protein